MEILQQKKCYNISSLASDNFKLSPPNGMPGGRAGKPGGIPGLNKHQLRGKTPMDEKMATICM